MRGFGRPNMLARMYLRMAGAGLPAQMYYVLDAHDRIDRAALRQAVAAVLDDTPQLRTRVVRHWYGYRRVVMPLSEVDLHAVLTLGSDADAVDAFLQHQQDFSRHPPIQLLHHERPDHDQLVIALHHSVGDGQSLLLVLARLRERYAAASAGRSLSLPRRPPEQEARYRDLLRTLSWPDRWRALAEAASYLSDAVRPAGSTNAAAVATFTDRPLPAEGRLRYLRIGISADQASALGAWAAARNGTRGDVMLAASLRAALRVWPRDAALPILVNLPVSLRSAADVDVTNRVAETSFYVNAGDFESVFAQVSRARMHARTRRPAVVNMFKLALASCLPPALFERLALRYFRRTTNARESLPFTFLGASDGGEQHFGPVAVTDSALPGSVIAPPGLRIVASPHGGRLNLCVSYLDPVISPASVQAFAGAVRAELDSLGE